MRLYSCTESDNSYLDLTTETPYITILHVPLCRARFLPLSKTTWGIKGAKQVDLTALDDKRQFTLQPCVNVPGMICGPVQLIWGGSTVRCHPKQDVCDKWRAFVSHAHSKSHWSTTETIIAFVTTLWTEFVKPNMLNQNLNPDTEYWLLTWDVYQSHRYEAKK